MGSSRQLFDSRLARRVFGVFMAASLLPLLALSLVLLDQVGKALEQQAFAQLETATRSYGKLTLDKLLAVGEDLSAVAASATASSTPSASLDALTVVANGRERPLLGHWSPPRASRLDTARSVITVAPRDGGAEIVVASTSGAGVAYGRIASGYLEATNTLLGLDMEACILPAASLAPIQCSASFDAQTLEAIDEARRSGPVGRLSWTTPEAEWLAAHWQLFLPSRFEAEPWTIVVAQPRDTALASLAIFNRVVPQAALFTLALIAVLALGQIRRTLHPLNELLAGTKRIAAQDFATPVNVAPHDEFGTLGTALNSMAAQLERQFDSLRALAAIDRSILQSTDIAPVLDTLFARLAALAPSARHTVLVIDSDNSEHAHLYRSGRAGSADIERIKVAPRLREWLAGIGAERDVDAATLAAMGLNVASAETKLSVVPLMTGDAPAGALLSVCGTLDEPARRAIREIAARVAVAISASKREAELFRRAHFDMLTQLPNRELLHDRLHQAVAHAEREERQLAVLFIDLDRFKEINDTLGHRSGDELLQDTALRLTAILRQGDTVARLGGDEYAIVLPQVQSVLEAEAVAIKVIEALRRPFAVGGRENYVSASVGIALFPDDGRSASELLRKADMAMYTAKDAGKGCYRFFAAEMDQRLHERHSLHHDLRSALDAGEFTLAYQPQIDLKTGRLESAEALLRWQHPARGVMSPALFVPVLEESGLIKEVGDWVLRRALADFAAWRRSGLPLERIAVNVSGRQLLDRNFVDTLVAALRESGIAGSHLEIELTEASLIEDFRTANDALSELHRHGVQIALDDFGTGYSSLAYLNELVFDTLKIDRAFVVNLPAQKSVGIVKAIIAVAQTLGKNVVAEGIESELQCQQLAALGCTLGQGYLFAKPLSPSGLAAWAARQTLAKRSSA